MTAPNPNDDYDWSVEQEFWLDASDRRDPSEDEQDEDEGDLPGDFPGDDSDEFPEGEGDEFPY